MNFVVHYLNYKNSLPKLHQLEWIDEKTRAVIIQLFTSVTFLVEILSTGGIIATARFESINLYSSLYGFYHLFYDHRNSFIY